jgi:hypothetical protein
LPPAAVAKQTVDGSQSAEVQHGLVQKLALDAAMYTSCVTLCESPQTPLAQSDPPLQRQPSPLHPESPPVSGMIIP